METNHKIIFLLKILILFSPIFYYLIFFALEEDIPPYFMNLFIYFIPILYLIISTLFFIKTGFKRSIFEVIVVYCIYLPLLVIFYIGINTLKF